MYTIGVKRVTRSTSYKIKVEGAMDRTNRNQVNIDNKGLTRSTGENTKEFICNSKDIRINTTIKGLNKMIETNIA